MSSPARTREKGEGMSGLSVNVMQSAKLQFGHGLELGWGLKRRKGCGFGVFGLRKFKVLGYGFELKQREEKDLK